MKNRIRQLREEKGLTQEQLGEMVGTSRQAINAIETEKSEPSIWLAYDISQVFGCTIEEVFFFEESSMGRFVIWTCGRGETSNRYNWRHQNNNKGVRQRQGGHRGAIRSAALPLLPV